MTTLGQFKSVIYSFLIKASLPGQACHLLNFGNQYLRRHTCTSCTSVYLFRVTGARYFFLHNVTPCQVKLEKSFNEFSETLATNSLQWVNFYIHVGIIIIKSEKLQSIRQSKNRLLYYQIVTKQEKGLGHCVSSAGSSQCMVAFRPSSNFKKVDSSKVTLIGSLSIFFFKYKVSKSGPSDRHLTWFSGNNVLLETRE